ncbi:alpha/beta hydrolase family protein [Histidinibacterium aquaticum]|uniref:Alpha/beta hydrolase n=1 Tax=Histidinibacterium aquaticum TaxID=2613962 RepID=A0A5J5GDB1_9RHOB|nr:hypothetical protein [Histidinibacterium aquaticum]KAA9006017.1 hypothetical protein F3S47_15810 [Histidinibacterium aquaticum]
MRSILVLLAALAAAPLTAAPVPLQTDSEFLPEDAPEGLPTTVLTAHVDTYRALEETGDPVIMIPAPGLDGDVFTGTPDGREGWAQIFREAGRTVHVFTDPGILMSGESRENARRWSADGIWTSWGLGPEPGEPYEDTRYPVQDFETFTEGLPDHVALSEDRELDRALRAASLLTLMEDACPCAIIAQSGAAGTVMRAVQMGEGAPEALVLIEPDGVIADPEASAETFDRFPVLAIFGDRIEERDMARRKEGTAAMLEALRDKGVTAAMMDLPGEGIAGNTHLLPQDVNSAALAERVLRWLDDPSMPEG